jgi:hypothetical protein
VAPQCYSANAHVASGVSMSGGLRALCYKGRPHSDFTPEPATAITYLLTGRKTVGKRTSETCLRLPTWEVNPDHLAPDLTQCCLISVLLKTKEEKVEFKGKMGKCS